MLKRLVVVAAVVLASGGVGVYLALQSLLPGSNVASFVRSGLWVTSTVTGSSKADLHTRAYVARIGLLALAPEETTYYHAYADEHGDPLSSDYIYEVRGKDIPARWWSITLYNFDSFLIPNTDDRYSVKSTTLKREPDGSFVIYLSRQPHDGNWIATDHGHGMSLALRMYNPPDDIRQKLDKLDLPIIRKVGRAP